MKLGNRNKSIQESWQKDCLRSNGILDAFRLYLARPMKFQEVSQNRMFICMQQR